MTAVDPVARTPFVGAWQLREVISRDRNGRPFVDYDKGLLCYTETGHFSASLCNTRAAGWQSSHWNQATLEELRTAFDRYTGYFGTYVIDAPNRQIIHRCEGSFFPPWLGGEQRRLFELRGDQLTLRLPPGVLPDKDASLALVWERMLR